MKRIWFATIFLLLCVGLCTGEQLYVRKVYSDINNEISKIEKYEKADDIAEGVNNIKKYWDKNNNLLFTIADHGVLDDLSTAIRSLDAKDEELKKDLTEVKSITKVFYENQKITFANIF